MKARLMEREETVTGASVFDTPRSIGPVPYACAGGTAPPASRTPGSKRRAQKKWGAGEGSPFWVAMLSGQCVGLQKRAVVVVGVSNIGWVSPKVISEPAGNTAA